jgi:ribonuclease P/MRP protein subunit RPP1
MGFYDYCTNLENPEKAVEFAKGLGWSGLAVSLPEKKGVEEFRTLSRKIKGFDLILGVGIKSGSSNVMKRSAKKIRTQYEVLIGHGGTPDLNRAVLETPEFDILVNHPVENRCGINHVLARLAKKNNVSICLDFNQLLVSYGKTRTSLLSILMETAKIIRKYKAPFVVSSGAFSAWDMRSPHDLTVFGKILGLPESQVKFGISERMIKENRKRLSGKWIMPGVEIEK